MSIRRLVTLLRDCREIQLGTEFVYPPIPIRSSDWAAFDATNEDNWDGEGSRGPFGTGATEIEAINDLFDQLEE